MLFAAPHTSPGFAHPVQAVAGTTKPFVEHTAPALNTPPHNPQPFDTRLIEAASARPDLHVVSLADVRAWARDGPAIGSKPPAWQINAPLTQAFVGQLPSYASAEDVARVFAFLSNDMTCVTACHILRGRGNPYAIATLRDPSVLSAVLALSRHVYITPRHVIYVDAAHRRNDKPLQSLAASLFVEDTDGVAGFPRYTIVVDNAKHKNGGGQAAPQSQGVSFQQPPPPFAASAALPPLQPFMPPMQQAPILVAPGQGVGYPMPMSGADYHRHISQAQQPLPQQFPYSVYPPSVATGAMFSCQVPDAVTLNGAMPTAQYALRTPEGYMVLVAPPGVPTHVVGSSDADR